MNQNNNLQLQPFYKLTSLQKDAHNLSELNHAPFILMRSQNDQKKLILKSKSAGWRNQQKQKYSIFICYFRQILSSGSSNFNELNMFKAMSKYIGSRNPLQCRSYHLKLLKQFHTIGKFIKIVAKKLPSLREKILKAEDQLNNLQSEFNLFIEEQVRQQNQCLNSVNCIPHQKQCKQLPKTSDTYFQEPNPLGNYLHNFNFNSFETFNPQHSFNSDFKSFGYKPPGKQSIPSFAEKKSSLPSFAEEQEFEMHQKPVKQQIKQDNHMFSNYEWKNYTNDFFNQQEKKWSNNIFEKNDAFTLNDESIKNQQKKNDFFSFSMDQSSKRIEKMKEILECHYLFQLWTSKLETIMRE